MIGGPKSTRSINEAGTKLETAGERMVGPKVKDENESEHARRVKYWDNLSEKNKTDKEKQIRECREAIGSINRSVLYGIILKMKRKSTGWIAGSGEERKFIRFIDQVLNDVVVEDNDSSMEHMEIRTKVLQKYKVKENPKLVVNLNFYLENKDNPFFIRCLIHEILHISSLSQKENYSVGMSYMSYLKFNKEGVSYSENFIALNEALTEFITDEVEEEYLHNTGGITEARKTIRFTTYPFERMILKEIIKELALYLKVDKKEIMQALMGHYFRADWVDVVGEILEGIDNTKIKNLFLMSQEEKAPTLYVRSKRFEIFKRKLRMKFSNYFRGLIERFETI